MSEEDVLIRTQRERDGVLVVELRGTIDAGSDLRIPVDPERPYVIFDLDGVQRITSFGVREWTKAMTAGEAGKLFFVNCRPAIVGQFNMVTGFAGVGEPLTIYMPYACDACGTESAFLLHLIRDRTVLTSGAEPQPNVCPTCGKEAVFDDIAESYFSFFARRPVPHLPEPVRRALDPAVQSSRRLRVQKEIIDAVTAVWLSGTLDEKARLKRALDGVAGLVLVVAPGLSLQSAAAGQHLRVLLQLKDADVWFARVPLGVIRALSPDDARAILSKTVSVVVPTHCPSCQTDVGVMADAGVEHGGSSMCVTCGAAVVHAPFSPAEAAILARLPVAPATVERYLAGRVGLTLRGHEEDSASPATHTTVADAAPMSRYKVLQRLGVGGMAEVLIAEQSGPDRFRRQVVIKRILPSYANRKDIAEMFLHEARAIASISHPNVVQVYDVGVDSGHYFLAMEYVRGVDLRGLQSLANAVGVPIPGPIAARIIADAAAGLYAAHEARDESGRPLAIVHRDISPQNLLLSFDGNVKVVDFGISKSTSSEWGTEPGVLKGKVIYMAPEQIDPAFGAVDHRADVYALGLVLYYLLTNDQPFLRGDQFANMSAALKVQIPSIRESRPDLPEELAGVVATALTRDLALRHQSANAFRQGLESYLAHSGTPTTSVDVANWLTWLRGMAGSAPAETVEDVDVKSSAVTKHVSVPSLTSATKKDSQ